MNNKKTITICSIVALVMLAIVIIITLMTDLIEFSIILGALFIILAVVLGIYLKEEPDEYSAYIKNKKRILRTYNSIIVEVEDIPNIAGKNIIKVKSIEDLVDAQLELREPIYYKNDNDSCFFLLLHYNEACIYILKMNESVISTTEQSIRYMREDKTNLQNNKNLLNNLENTIVYKLDELRSFKISPIRNKTSIKVVNDTAIKHGLKQSKKKHITKEYLEEEISKTMYINDLKEKIRQYEEEEKKLYETLEMKIVEPAFSKKNKQKPSKKIDEKPVAEKQQPEKIVVDKKVQDKKIASKKDTHQSRRTINYNKKRK